MRISSSYPGAAPYSTYGKYGLDVEQDRQKKEENSLVSAAAGKIAEKMKTSPTISANDAILNEQSALIASQAQQTSDNDLAVAAEIVRLRQKEREVIAHEAAHKAAGGQYMPVRSDIPTRLARMVKNTLTVAMFPSGYRQPIIPKKRCVWQNW